MKEISIHFSKIQNSMIQTDSWTRQPMLVHQSYNRLCIEPKFLIKRKLIMYPCYHSQPTCSPSFYLAINVVVVPIYPSIGEIVHARHSENSIITLKVTNIHINENTVEGHILKEIVCPCNFYYMYIIVGNLIHPSIRTKCDQLHN